MELNCKVQYYHWGKVGMDSIIAQILKDRTKISDQPYAELWMGTHVNGPSMVKDQNKPLSKLLEEHPEYLGEPTIEKFGHDLPFLFKVLSVNSSLSIQAHPSKEMAVRLHQTRPDLYRDENHKPELIIALTEFHAMCGFRRFKEIQAFFYSMPELKGLIKTNLRTDADLKQAFTEFMQNSNEVIALTLQKLLKRLENANENVKYRQMYELVNSLNAQYPNDVGCFAPYFMNVIKLQPFEAMFLGPNVPHAYLYGDCVECMTRSDNVVRGGLTPKYKDLATFCEMLNYNGHGPDENIMKPLHEESTSAGDQYLVYAPPIEDFCVIKITLGEGDRKVLKTRTTPSIVLCMDGEAKVKNITVSSGTVLFVPSNHNLMFQEVRDELLLFQAMVNLK